MRRLVLLVLLPLAACATPQEQCISAATKDLRVINRLIAQTEGNVERGYAIEKRQEIVMVDSKCKIGDTVYKCEVPETEERRVPVAVDLDAEAAKLASLKTRRAKMETEVRKQIEACRLAYPAEA